MAGKPLRCLSQAGDTIELIFSGEYEHRIDPQGRVSVPARFRPAFENGIVLSRAYERCLVIYTPEEFTVVAGEIRKQPQTSADARRLARITFSGAYELALDRHGRFLVPQPLREYAGLEDDVVIIGTGRFLEVWSRAAWTEERSALDEDAVEIAERAGRPAGGEASG
jgi:MraZ protein